MPFDKNINYKYVKEFIENEGYELISTVYAKQNDKLEMICPNKHVCFISFANFKWGRRCRKCVYKRISKNRSFSYDYVKSEIEKNDGYKLISKNYESVGKPLNIQCPKGHLFEKPFNLIQRGQLCPICSKENRRKKLSFSYNEVKNNIENNNYVLISQKYKNVKTKI